MTQQELLHLYLRAGFGLTSSDFNGNSGLSRHEVVDSIFKKSENFEPLSLDLSRFDILKNNGSMMMEQNDEVVIKKLKNDLKKEIMHFNEAWINRLCTSDNMLREKMTLFWSNVFVVNDNNIWFIQQYNNVVRKHALGNFGDLVKAIAREPSMSKYLNNKQNIKSAPNENFARELMELFTLGEGQYTETDIKNAAKAFTGWSYKKNGAFFLRIKQHDFGPKVFMGERGNFDGDDIIDIILKQKQCAKFICSKLYRYFVNPDIDKKRVNEMAEVFYKDYDIAKLMHYMFSSDWFYDDKNVGSKIKSPIELYVGIQKLVPLTIDNDKTLIVLQRMMGQTLLKPPNVAGWKGHRHWIDSNSIMIRLKLASMLLTYKEIKSIELTTNKFYKTFIVARNHLPSNAERIKAWDQFAVNFRNVDESTLEKLIIAGSVNAKTKNLIESFKAGNKEAFCLKLMSLPEFQMC